MMHKLCAICGVRFPEEVEGDEVCSSCWREMEEGIVNDLNRLEELTK